MPCEFCGTLFPFSSIELHERQCRARTGLGLGKGTHEIATENLVNLFLCVTSIEQDLRDERITRHIGHLAGKPGHTIEIRAQANAIDAGHFHHLVDVVSNPIHATGVGLLLYAKSNQEVQRTEAPLLAGGMKSIFERMKAWFQGNF